MGKRISVGIAGLITLATSVGMFGDDVGRLISHTPHRPPTKVTVPPIHKPPRIEIPPLEVPPIQEPPRIEVPPVVREWTDHLNTKNAAEVTEVACTLKDLDEFASAESNDERWRIAGEYLFEEGKLEVAVGLAQDMVDGEDLDALEAYCGLFG
jgi:hypothetical protein